MTSRNKPSVNQHKVVLLIVDVQKGLFKKSTPIYQAEKLLENINTLVDRAHRAGATVFFVQHSDKKTLAKGSDGWRLHPRLHPLDIDCIIPKRHVNAFEDTVLEEELNSRGVGTLVVTGLVTYACVRATCIGAKKLGYRVILARDGHSNYSKHAAQVIEDWNEKLSVGIVEVKSTSEIEFG
ncbi:MAG: isochorismatase family cysteine hydrolase [Chloroflexota bacterium]